jgi:hypothetical protein
MKSPTRPLDFKALTRKIRKRRMAAFKESVKDFGVRWKNMMTEMEEIYRSIEIAPDLSEHDKEKLAADFMKGNEAFISEWINGAQSIFELLQNRASRIKARKK